MSNWQPIDTAPRRGEAFFWIVPKTADETYYDTSGKPILANVQPFWKLCQFGWWSALMKATHWMPLPDLAAPDGPEEAR